MRCTVLWNVRSSTDSRSSACEIHFQLNTLWFRDFAHLDLAIGLGGKTALTKQPPSQSRAVRWLLGNEGSVGCCPQIATCLQSSQRRASWWKHDLKPELSAFTPQKESLQKWHVHFPFVQPYTSKKVIPSSHQDHTVPQNPTYSYGIGSTVPKEKSPSSLERLTVGYQSPKTSCLQSALGKQSRLKCQAVFWKAGSLKNKGCW